MCRRARVPALGARTLTSKWSRTTATVRWRVLSLDWVRARNTEAQKVLGGVAKDLMLVLMARERARSSHAGKVAPEQMLPRVRAVCGVGGEERR